MRRPWIIPLTILLLITAVPALAATSTSASSSYDVSWAALDPGSDWAAQMIEGLFPIAGISGTAAASATEQTVISQIVGQLTGFVAAIAMAFLCYSTIMQIHRGAETGRILSNSMSGMFIVRLGFAAIMMFPIPTQGFSVGQEAVVQMALWGVGMAKAVYTNAIQAIGPSGMVISQPIIPGTETVVLGLIQNELCRGLINAATNNSNLVPEPTPQKVGSAADPLTVMSYSMAVGDVGVEPACGYVQISAPLQNYTNLDGVSFDQTALQAQALTSVTAYIAGKISGDDGIAATYFKERKAADLQPLSSVLMNATQMYESALTSDATAIQNKLRSSFTNGSGTLSGLANSNNELAQLKGLGWTGAGAYYLEFAKLNAATLSLLNATPQITPPTYAGIGPSLTADMTPLIGAAQAYMSALSKQVTTSDPINTPGGQGDIFSGATPGGDGNALVEQIFRRMHLSDYALQALQAAVAPSKGSGWTDPFSSLMGVGNLMINLALGAMAAAAIASSATATAASAGVEFLTGHFVAAGGTIAAHSMFTFLSTPIFTLVIGLLVPGMTIAFVLPMIPWVMWMAGVAGWLILVCEAVIAVPLWMLAHMTMEGEGLHGKAMHGYGLIFNVLFRPTLMIFGLFLGYFIFTSMSYLICQTFGIAAGFVLEHGWIVTNVLGIIVLMSIFVMTHVVAALTSFRMISMIPDHVPQWIGFGGGARVDMDSFSRDAALVGVGGTLLTASRGLQDGMENAMKDKKLTAPKKDVSAEKTLGLSGPSSSGSDNGMDTTLRLTSDVSPGSSEGEETED